MAIKVKYDVVDEIGFDVDEVVSKKGVYTKVFGGILITMLAYFVGLSLNFPQYIYNDFVGILVWFGLIFGQYAMYAIIARNGANGKSSLVPYAIFSVVEGLQLSYIVTIFSIIYLNVGPLDGGMISAILLIVTFGVFIISLVTGIVAANMKVTTKTLGFMGSINRVILITMTSIMAFFGISLLFSLFGQGALLNNMFNLFYGFGFAGIAFSVIMVALAAFGLLSAFYYINVAQANGAKKQFEWILATGVLANMVWLFIEILRLVLKIVANSRN